ncbi:DUF4232 domain-containing protein [Streptomyces sp. NPDC015032]|uniref:DUF4232 domain-containing protein n=1 Tax=Streptomyces sp. NPDC015032 TaxID=3364937 RepID=UPI0036FEE3C3
MRTFRSRNRATVLGAAVTAVLALALTSCGKDGTGTKEAGPADNSAPAAALAGSSQSTGPVKTSGTTENTGAVKAASVQTRTTKAGGGTDTDSYAYKHPCDIEKLSVRVTGRSGAPTQRVIKVRNTGAKACGLSHYPRVSLGNSRAADHSHDVRPLVPGGPGGAPAYPVHAGHTAYAVIDLDPSGATTGTAPGIDELNVLADGDHMPNAATLNFPLGSGARVLKPKLGLYRSTVADAVRSMTQADTQS